MENIKNLMKSVQDDYYKLLINMITSTDGLDRAVANATWGSLRHFQKHLAKMRTFLIIHEPLFTAMSIQSKKTRIVTPMDEDLVAGFIPPSTFCDSRFGIIHVDFEEMLQELYTYVRDSGTWDTKKELVPINGYYTAENIAKDKHKKFAPHAFGKAVDFMPIKRDLAEAFRDNFKGKRGLRFMFFTNYTHVSLRRHNFWMDEIESSSKACF